MVTSPLLTGVYPVLATPFHADGSADEAGLVAIVNYAIASGVDGVVYPGFASECDWLTQYERMRLSDLVAREARGKVSLVVGGSSAETSTTEDVARRAQTQLASSLMVMAPRTITATQEVIAYFRRIAAATGNVSLMLQNAPPPSGGGLPVSVVLEVLHAVPQIQYVKEEALPSGARIAQMLAGAPSTLRGVFGGAGGRYITDELSRGVIGTMPACELCEVHVALMRAHLGGDRAAVRKWFGRMLPLLNFQAVFRWAMTKETLRRRGIIAHAGKRAPGPELDEGDHRELSEMLAELADVLSPPVVNG
jgi:4-hydroxy-tetrahydrodipicolinate synthase